MEFSIFSAIILIITSAPYFGHIRCWTSAMDPSTEPVCDEETTLIKANEEAKRMYFPQHEIHYENNLNCSWILQAAPGKQVELVVVKFLTESCCDKAELRDGNSTHAPLLLELRGNVTSGPMYISTFGSFFIHFSSDDSRTGSGFVIDYQIADTRTLGCGPRVLKATQDRQQLTSPLYEYGLQYPNLLHCFWDIHAQEGESVEVVFVYIQLERCCDYILVRDGLGMNVPTHELSFELLRTPIKLTSTGGVFQVVFRSDSNITRWGFEMFFRSVPKPTIPPWLSNAPIEETPCGGQIYVPANGQMHLTSPNFPRYYSNMRNCVWILIAPPGKTISIWFKKIDLEECCDFIKVRDGELSSSKKLAVLSGESRYSHTYTSSSNTLRIEFESDMSESASGFFAVFGLRQNIEPPPVMLCRMKKFVKEEDGKQYMDLPIWAMMFHGKEDCSLVISTTKHNTLTIGIHVTEVTRSRDQITVMDGRPLNSVELGKVTTSSHAVNVFNSNRNVVTLTLKHDPLQIIRPFFIFYYSKPVEE